MKTLIVSAIKENKVIGRVLFQVKENASQGVITTNTKKALGIEGKTKTIPHGESTYKITDSKGSILAYVETL